MRPAAQKRRSVDLGGGGMLAQQLSRPVTARFDHAAIIVDSDQPRFSG